MVLWLLTAWAGESAPMPAAPLPDPRLVGPAEVRPLTERWLAPDAFVAPGPAPREALSVWRLGATPSRPPVGSDDQGATGLASTVRADGVLGADVAQLRARAAVAGPLADEVLWLQGLAEGQLGRAGRRQARGQAEGLRVVARPAEGHQLEARVAGDHPSATVPAGERRGWGAGAAAAWRWAPTEQVEARVHGLTEARSLLGTERERQGARLGFRVRHDGDRWGHRLLLGAETQRLYWSGGGYWTWRWLGGQVPQRGPTEVLRSGLVVEELVTYEQTWWQVGARADAVDGGAPWGPRAQIGTRVGPMSVRSWAARRFTHLDLPVVTVGGPARRDEAGLWLGLEGLDEALSGWVSAKWTDHRAVPFFGGSRIDLQRLHTEVGGRARGAWVRSEGRWAHVGGVAGGVPLDDGSLARFKDEVDVSAALRLLDPATPLWVGVGRSWRLEPLGVVAPDPAWDQVVPIARDVRAVQLSHERPAGVVEVEVGAEVAHVAAGIAPRLTDQWLAAQSALQPLSVQAGWRGRLWLEVRR